MMGTKLARNLFQTCPKGLSSICGQSVLIQNVKYQLMKAAGGDWPVLLRGETGVGKELAARGIHALSKRSNGPFVAVNMANIPESLAESGLFGVVQGAFTDAKEDKQGLIEVAKRGSLFFDEISECSTNVQSKLLRVIENKEITRLGDTLPIKANPRYIFATNRDNLLARTGGTIREDLYHRISAIEIVIPPLRDRLDDIPILAANILDNMNRAFLKRKRISERALKELSIYAFPGNVRELENILRRAFIFCESDCIDLKDLVRNKPNNGKGAVLSVLYEKLLRGENYWETIHLPFLRRELSRDEVRSIIAKGLLEAGNSIKSLSTLFNVGRTPQDYKRFWDALHNHKLR